jgi:hypothetical protein
MRCLSAWSRAQPDGRAAGAVGPEQTSQRNTIAELIMRTISSAAAAPHRDIVRLPTRSSTSTQGEAK